MKKMTVSTLPIIDFSKKFLRRLQFLLSSYIQKYLLD